MTAMIAVKTAARHVHDGQRINSIKIGYFFRVKTLQNMKTTVRLVWLPVVFQLLPLVLEINKINGVQTRERARAVTALPFRNRY